MKSKRNLYHWLRDNICQLRYYTSIETLPIQNWFKFHKVEYGREPNYKLLVKNKAFPVIYFLLIIPFLFVCKWLALLWMVAGLLIKDKHFAPRVWGEIYDEFIDRIGLTPEYLAYLEKTKQIALLECECVIDPSPINKVILGKKRIDLKAAESKKTTEYNEIIAQVSKKQGYPVWNVSVFEFYSYLNGK